MNRVSKLVRTGTSTNPIYERTVYIDGIFEYHILENGSTYEKNYVHVMDDQSRIATVRIGDQFPDDIADAVTYNLEDQIGSSTVRLNTTGGVIDREEYYPFGDSSLRTFTKKRYRYIGREKDLESGLYYYGARYYSAWTCRFISVDPLSAKYAQLSPYNYSDNNPINDYDIDGMQNNNSEGSVQGGNSSPEPSNESTINNVFVNGHAKDFHNAEGRKNKASESVNEAKDNLSNIDKTTDKAGYKSANKTLKIAQRQLRKEENNYNRIKNDYDVVENAITKVNSMEDKLVFNDRIIKDLANEKLNKYVNQKVGDQLRLVDTLKQKNAQITIYNNKPNTQHTTLDGITAPAVNIRTGSKSWNIYLQNGGGETAIFNEIGDIYFSIVFPHHYGNDMSRVKKEADHKKVSNQTAYLNLYHTLYMEKFSGNVQEQAGQLIRNR